MQEKIKGWGELGTDIVPGILGGSVGMPPREVL